MAEAGGRASAAANRAGALWVLGSAVAFTVNGLLVKLLAASGIHFMQIGFARAFFAVLPLLPFLLRNGSAAFRTRHAGTHLLRAICGAGAMVSGFYALAHLPLATVTALGFTVPLFTVCLSVVLLGERVRWRRWSATLIGFAGVLVILGPEALAGASSVPASALAAGIGMALGIAVAVILIKRFPAGESHAVMLLYFCVASILITGGPALVNWRPPDAGQWLLLVGVGLVGVAGQAMIIRAYRSGEASFVAPFDYIKLPIAGLLGFLAFAEVPGLQTWLGALAIVMTTAYIAKREAAVGCPSPAPGSERG